MIEGMAQTAGILVGEARQFAEKVILAKIKRADFFSLVRPGDTIRYSCKVTGKRDLASKPKWGIVFSMNEGINQKGELVFSFEGKVLTARR